MNQDQQIQFHPWCVMLKAIQDQMPLPWQVTQKVTLISRQTMVYLTSVKSRCQSKPCSSDGDSASGIYDAALLFSSVAKRIWTN